jgi:hypothetical protein
MCVDVGNVFSDFVARQRIKFRYFQLSVTTFQRSVSFSFNFQFQFQQEIFSKSRMPLFSCELCCVDYKNPMSLKFHQISGGHLDMVKLTTAHSLAGLGNVYSLARVGKPADSKPIDEPVVVVEPVSANPPADSKPIVEPVVVVVEPVSANPPAATVSAAVSYDCDFCGIAFKYNNTHDYILHISRNSHILRYIRQSARQNQKQQERKRANPTAPNAEPAKKIARISYP